MTGDALFRWLSGHRIAPDGCSRDGRTSVVYFRDHAERPVCFGCVIDAAAHARTVAEATQRLEDADHLARRLDDLTRDDR